MVNPIDGNYTVSDVPGASIFISSGSTNDLPILIAFIIIAFIIAISVNIILILAIYKKVSNLECVE
jgi:hypothetical protein